MQSNYLNWGERRKGEFMGDEKLTAEQKTEEVRKLEERLGKFRDKMAFLEQLKGLPRRHSGNGPADLALAKAAAAAAGDGAVVAKPPPVVRRASIRPTVI